MNSPHRHRLAVAHQSRLLSAFASRRKSHTVSLFSQRGTVVAGRDTDIVPCEADRCLSVNFRKPGVSIRFGDRFCHLPDRGKRVLTIRHSIVADL